MSVLTLQLHSKKFEISVGGLMILGWIVFFVSQSPFHFPKFSTPEIATTTTAAAPARTKTVWDTKKMSRSDFKYSTNLPVAVDQANQRAGANVLTVDEAKGNYVLSIDGGWLLLTDGRRPRVSRKNFDLIAPVLHQFKYVSARVNVTIESKSNADPQHIRTLEKFFASFNGLKPNLSLNDSLSSENRITYEVAE